jgi:hypothetical protein
MFAEVWKAVLESPQLGYPVTTLAAALLKKLDITHHHAGQLLCTCHKL